ncbi:MAG: aminotransferase class V-fold PLP-dependent enzyme [Phycisphaerales bacterium]
MSAAPHRLPAPSDLAHHWALDPDVVYLNHGSFGACPIPVLEAQSAIRAKMEREAVRFFVIDLWELTDKARNALAPIVGARPQDIVFVRNATSGVAAVMASLELAAGDEVLFLNQEYPACRAIVRAACARAGAIPVEATLPWPLTDPGQAVEAILSKVTPRTRLCLLSHITSGTALVLPIAEIIEELRARGVETLLDAAHSAGQVELDLTALAPAYATGNCHKWLCAPKGAAFLWVRHDMQGGVRPPFESVYSRELGPSHARGPGTRSRFNLDFDYLGTDDYTPRLTLPAAIAFMEGALPGGLDEVRAHNRAMAVRATKLLRERLGTPALAPESMMASMGVVALPGHDAERGARLASRPTWYADALQDALVERHAIQAPVWSVAGGAPGSGRFLRLSAQLYNSPAQYEYLADALEAELERERGL